MVASFYSRNLLFMLFLKPPPQLCSRVVKCKKLQCSVMKYCTVCRKQLNGRHCNEISCSDLKCASLEYSAVSCSIVQFSSVQMSCSVLQCLKVYHHKQQFKRKVMQGFKRDAQKTSISLQTCNSAPLHHTAVQIVVMRMMNRGRRRITLVIMLTMIHI